MQRLNKKEMILNGNMYKVLLTLSIPIMINNFIQTLYNIVDGIWVSKLSSVHFAATSFVWPVNFLFLALGIGVSVAGTSILAQLIGSGREKDANNYTTQLIVVSLIMSIAFAIIGILLSPIVIRLMGARGELAELGNTYLKITFLDLPFLFLFFNINSIRTAQGDTVTPTVLSGIAALINVVLDPIFIFTFGWGIAGAAWATLVSRALLSMYGIKLISAKDNHIRPNFKNFKFDKTILKELWKVGFPASIGQSGAAFGFIILNSFIVSYGTTTMAAFGMVNRITSLVMQPAMGIGAALTAVIGQNLGANKVSRSKEAYKKGSILSLTMGFIGLALLLLFDKEIINFFIQSKDDPGVINQGITYLRYISLSMPLMGMFSVYQGLFQGSGHTKYSMFMEIGRLWLVRIPMILMFKYLTGWGPEGIWFSMGFSNLIVVIYGFIIYKRGRWKERLI